MKLIDLMEVATLYSEDYGFLWESITLDGRLDKGVLIRCIVNTLGQCEPLTNTVATFQSMTNTFFKKWEYSIGKLIDTLYFEYNPIWNKDGTITENHKFTRDTLGNKKRNEDTDENTTDTGTDNTEHTNEHEVSAYNSGDYQPHSTDSGHDNETRNLKGSRNVNVDIDETENNTETFEEGTERIEQGNIGVTTTQQMITEERALMEFNIYDWIVQKYGDECFLKIW